MAVPICAPALVAAALCSRKRRRLAAVVCAWTAHCFLAAGVAPYVGLNPDGDKGWNSGDLIFGKEGNEVRER